MSDKELEAIKQRKLQELRNRAALREQKSDQVDAQKILNKVLKGRALEVFNTARAQFPVQMAEVENLLVRLSIEGKITELDGEQLYTLLRKLGLSVRLNTTIRVVGHGRVKSLSEKFAESTK